MTLATGTQLGVYEILSPLGVGGMGEVYRARDTKLAREVAIKVLPEELARDRERLVRFEREAKLLAGLNHPNIATLYGLETIDDQQLLIMELVEGETLAERIARGPIPLDEAIALFVQIAEGLGAAHDKGVVHRDLKPANIKITPDGKVKILDFGLAKAFDEDEVPGQGTSQSPTRTKATAMGVILGTAPYMSPEQARGKAVDKRTDIWAFGCCLFEALTGSKTFDGETVTDTLAAIVKNGPAWWRLPAETPREVRLMLRRCLDKDANRRPYDARDLRLLMEEGLEEETPAMAHSTRRSVLPIVAAAAFVVGLLVWGLLGSRTAERLQTSRLEIHLRDQVLDPGLSVGSPIAFSPDGTSIVYAARDEASTRLYLRRLDDFRAQAIPNTEGGIHPFFSSDGEWIGFDDGLALIKVSVSGGVRLELADVSTSARGGSWTEDGKVAFAGNRMGISTVPESGGESIAVTHAGPDERHSFPEMLPNDAGLLFALTAERRSRIAVLSFQTGEWRVLEALGEGSGAKYLPTGHLVYVHNGTLLAAPFDLSRLDATGPPTPVLEGIVSPTNAGLERPLYSVSNSGHLAYVPGASTIQRQLVWVGRNGRETPVRAELGAYEYLSLSPDETRVAYTKHDAGHNAWVYDLERGTETRLTRSSSGGCVWAPNGRYCALNMGGIYWQDADGGAVAELIVQDGATPGAWSPDGTVLIYVRSGDVRDLWAKPLSDLSRVHRMPSLRAHSINTSRRSRRTDASSPTCRPSPVSKKSTFNPILPSTGGGSSRATAVENLVGPLEATSSSTDASARCSRSVSAPNRSFGPVPRKCYSKGTTTRAVRRTFPTTMSGGTASGS